MTFRDGIVGITKQKAKPAASLKVLMRNELRPLQEDYLAFTAMAAAAGLAVRASGCSGQWIDPQRQLGQLVAALELLGEIPQGVVVLTTTTPREGYERVHHVCQERIARRNRDALPQ